jgi:hypothetical protein
MQILRLRDWMGYILEMLFTSCVAWWSHILPGKMRSWNLSGKNSNMNTQTTRSMVWQRETNSYWRELSQ